MDKIFVIMPVWIQNTEISRLTGDAIQSLGDVDLLIIDNGSEGIWSAGIYSYYTNRTILRNPTNLGYAKAVNQGLKLAPKGLVAIANNDIRVSSNWQEVVREIFKSDPEIYSVHPRMGDYDQPFQFGNVIAPTGKERWCQGSFFVIKHDPDNPIFYDENFFNSYDDWDYWLRVREKGLKTCYTNMCAFQHHHSFTRKQLPNWEEQNIKNTEYFKQKYGKYAEDLFAEQFADQVKIPYWEGFH